MKRVFIGLKNETAIYKVIACILCTMFIIAILATLRVSEADVRLEINSLDVQFTLAEDWEVGPIASNTIALPNICHSHFGATNLHVSSLESSENGAVFFGEKLKLGTFIQLKLRDQTSLMTIKRNDILNCGHESNLPSTFVAPNSGAKMASSHGMKEAIVRAPIQMKLMGQADIMFDVSDDGKGVLLEPAVIQDISFELTEHPGYSDSQKGAPFPKLSAIQSGKVVFSKFPAKNVELQYGQPIRLQLKQALVHEFRITDDQIQISMIARIKRIRTGFPLSKKAAFHVNLMPSRLEAIATNSLFTSFSAFILFLMTVLSFFQSRRIKRT